ncbi:MAG TPA: MFS transporter [Candidatus Angelobacter sp.]|nr:MFS transporter [Candidatus Angelobacter sp.]
MPSSSRRNLTIIYFAAWMRSFAIGLLGVVLGVFLYREGLSTIAIGLVIAAGLAGAAVGTLFVTLAADRLGRRSTLCMLSFLTVVGTLPLIFHSHVAVLVPLAFVGMLNGMGTDRSAAFAMEQAVIPGLVSDEKRTWSLAWYNMVLDASGALGALAAGIPFLEQRFLGWDMTTSYRTLFLGCAALNVISGVLYLFLSSDVEIAQTAVLRKQSVAISREAKSTVARLAALFSLDSMGGGFLTDALVSYWFFRRFGIAESKLGLLFFTVHVLNALSHLGAAWLAKRIGLLKTMVFTHLPSSIFLIAAAFAPSAGWAIVLFLLRESLVEMDVPTRQSYVSAVVHPSERTFASGVTNLTRNLSWAAASSVAGLFMQRIAFSAPLLIGGGLKIMYDVLLWRAFRHVIPPEEKK